MASKPRLRSLTRRADFQALKQNGNTFHVNSWLLVNWRPGEDQGLRCGWTIPAHIGTAVIRNRLKRWGREFMRQWVREREQKVDLNVILKRREPGFYKVLKHEEFNAAMEKLVAKLSRHLP